MFPHFTWFNAIVKSIESIYYLFYWWDLLLLLIQSGESIYDPPRFRFISWHLSYNKETPSNIKSFINSHWCSQSNLISTKKWFKKFFNNFICVDINHKFYLINLWMHYTLSRRNKLVSIVNWIFHVSNVLRSFKMPFKEGLILSWYFSVGSVLFLSVTFIIKIILTLKNSYRFVICFMLKMFLISLITQYLVASFSFFNLKRFFISLIAVSSISCVSLKIFLILLIMLSSIFFIFFKPFHHYTLWNKLVFLKKNKCLVESLKKCLKILSLR